MAEYISARPAAPRISRACSVASNIRPTSDVSRFRDGFSHNGVG